MSTDLDTRLRSLTELSPPSTAALGTEELHRRASKRQQRSLALRTIPVAVVVLAVLGALAMQSRATTTEVLVGPPYGGTTADGTTETSDTGEISARDREVIDFLRTAAELRHQLEREMVLSAVYASTDADVGRNALEDQRAATDVAVEAYTEGAARVSGSATGDESPLVEAITQADNRVTRLETNRTSVDAIQTDALGLIEAYGNTTAGLQGIAVGYLHGVQDPDVFRDVLSASNLGTVAQISATGAATTTVAVLIGYYPAILPKGANPLVEKGDCGDDPAGAGSACPVYNRALRLSNERDRAAADFHAFANPEQKQTYRAADAGSDYDQLLASAFEDGVGLNDLTGAVPGSERIDPEQWRDVALQRIDRLASAERRLYDSVA